MDRKGVGRFSSLREKKRMPAEYAAEHEGKILVVAKKGKGVPREEGICYMIPKRRSYISLTTHERTSGGVLRLGNRLEERTLSCFLGRASE